MFMWVPGARWFIIHQFITTISVIDKENIYLEFFTGIVLSCSLIVCTHFSLFLYSVPLQYLQFIYSIQFPFSIHWQTVPFQVVESGGKNIEIAVMTKKDGLRELDESEVDEYVAEIEAEKAAAEAAKKGAPKDA
jgi:hypothetical protein